MSTHSPDRKPLHLLTKEQLMEMHKDISQRVVYNYKDIEGELRHRRQTWHNRIFYAIAVAAFLAPLAFEIGTHFKLF